MSFEKKLEDTFYTNGFSFGKVVRDSQADILKTGIWIFSWVKKKNTQAKNKKNNKQGEKKKKKKLPVTFTSFLLFPPTE